MRSSVWVSESDMERISSRSNRGLNGSAVIQANSKACTTKWVISGSRIRTAPFGKDGVPAEQAAQWLESFQHGEVPAQLPQRFSGEEFWVSGRRLETLWDARDLLGTIEEDIRDLA
jgi:hypothetical protein